MDRVILHSDCNNFYASVECMLNPELKGKCVAVGGSEEERHGIVLAKNEIAKRFGIQTGDTLWQARLKCPDVIIVPPHFDEYIAISKAAREIYHDNTNQVEPFGLDEAWLDVTGENGFDAASRISDRIKRELGITVSIGVSFNKIFAKLGSDYKKPDAITVINRNNFKDIVWPLPVSDLLFVGRATTEKLHRMGVRTIGELAKTPEFILKNHFGKNGTTLHSFANGEEHSRVAEFGSVPPMKSMSNSITTPRDMVCRDDVLRVMTALCDGIGRRLRTEGIVGRRVAVYMRGTDLVTFSRQSMLNEYTDSTETILSEAMELVDANYDGKTRLRSIGVGIGSLSTAKGVSSQMSLFCSAARQESKDRLVSEIDRLRERYGSGIIVPATVLADPEMTAFEYKRRYCPFGIRSGEEC